MCCVQRRKTDVVPSHAPTVDLQKSRAHQSVPDETVAQYRAAKAFLTVEWVGAVLMVLSFAQLYVFGLRPGARVGLMEGVGVALLLAGGLLWFSARSAYYRIDFPWRRRSEFLATVVAGSGLVFWGMFLVAALLVWRGIDFL